MVVALAGLGVNNVRVKVKRMVAVKSDRVFNGLGSWVRG